MTTVKFDIERATNASPEAFGAAFKVMFGFSGYLEQTGLEHSLLELVKMRASQINGCAFCIDMHSKDARAAGETEQRLYLLSAWHESRAFYSPREQAALAWTEAVTLVAETHVPDEMYDEVRQHFSDDEIVALTMAVVAINGYNRLNVALRHAPGAYQPASRHELAGAAA